MRSSIFYAIGFAGLAAAIAQPAEEDDYSTTITIRVTSTVISVSYTATETVTGTPPPDASQTGDILSQVTMPASTLKTSTYPSPPSVYEKPEVFSSPSAIGSSEPEQSSTAPATSTGFPLVYSSMTTSYIASVSPNPVSYGSTASSTAVVEPDFSNSASSLLKSQEVIIAGAVSALSMIYALI